MSQLGITYLLLTSMVSSVRRVEAFLLQPERHPLAEWISSKESLIAEKPSDAPSIDIKDATFGSGSKVDLLQAGNVSIKAGQLTAIVGQTGSGKSRALQHLSAY